MTPHDPTSLDPEEYALAQRLARTGPHGEPSPALDSRILAAAHAAVAGHRGSGPQRSRRWPLGLGLAASLALALGLAWQLRPLPQVAPTWRSEADSALRTAPAAASTANVATEAPSEPSAATTTIERAQHEAEADSLPPATAEKPALAAAKTAPLQAPPLPPSPAAPQDPPLVFDAPAAMEAPSEPPRQARPAVHPESRAADGSTATAPAAAPQAFGTPRTTTEASGNAAADSMPMPPAPASARQKQTAPTTAPAAAVTGEDMPLEDVPPATVASPQVRDAWLARIRELAAGGKRDDARASLREFQNRYPDYPLPEDLRALLP